MERPLTSALPPRKTHSRLIVVHRKQAVERAVWKHSRLLLAHGLKPKLGGDGPCAIHDLVVLEILCDAKLHQRIRTWSQKLGEVHPQ